MMKFPFPISPQNTFVISMNRILTRRFYVPLLLFLISACTQIPTLSEPQGNRQLATQIHKVLLASGLRPNLGIYVQSLETGKMLYAWNADHLFMPASNNKLYTATAALKFLSPQYEFHTTLWTDSTAFHADTFSRLVLQGGGDPDLMPDQLNTLIRGLPKTLQAVDTLIIDNTRLDSVPFGEGWMWDEGPWWYAAQIDALSLNDNCIDFMLEPGPEGESPIVTIFPNTKYISVENQAVTVADTLDFRELKIDRDWWHGSNNFIISGEILVDEEKDTLWRNIEDPALFTGTVFSEQMRSAGINLTGPILKDTVRSVEKIIARYTSPRLAESLQNFLKASDNLSGELYVKTIGYEVSGQQGTWENGLRAVKLWLQEFVGIDTTDMRMADGSGVSRYNLTSPKQLVQLLTYVYHDHTINAEFMAALPTGGWDGTLHRRMDAIKKERAIRAKTGTLSGVSCLSGYAWTRDDEPLAFSIMMNGYTGSAKPYQELQDELCTILTNFKR